MWSGPKGRLLTESAWAESRLPLGCSAAVVPGCSRRTDSWLSWDGEEAFMPLNVENGATTTAASAKNWRTVVRGRHALRSWRQQTRVRRDPQPGARDRQPSDGFDVDLDSATPIDLDPLRRHDLQATFLSSRAAAGTRF